MDADHTYYYKGSSSSIRERRRTELRLEAWNSRRALKRRRQRAVCAAVVRAREIQRGLVEALHLDVVRETVIV